jgi:N-acetylglucosaminyl-diphospho-decaprenol L-rhamnosyltransferase
MDRTSSVSIVVATHNRCEQLLGTVERLIALPGRPQVIVVDNASSDRTQMLVESSFPDVTLVCLPHNIGAYARNIGVVVAATPYVAFSDDDSWWAQDALRVAGAAFEQSPQLGLIAARILVGSQQRLDPTCVRMAVGPIEDGVPGHAIAGFVACGAVVRREAFLDAGGFHPRYGMGAEERMLALDLLERGWRLAYVPEAVCHHDPAATGDREGRVAMVFRNDLWTAWLRHRARRALAETWATCTAAVRDRDRRRALVQAAAGIPWIVAERGPLSVELERYVLHLTRPTAIHEGGASGLGLLNQEKFQEKYPADLNHR